MYIYFNNKGILEGNSIFWSQICDLGWVEGKLLCLLFLDIQDCGSDIPESQD